MYISLITNILKKYFWNISSSQKCQNLKNFLIFDNDF